MGADPAIAGIGDNAVGLTGGGSNYPVQITGWRKMLVSRPWHVVEERIAVSISAPCERNAGTVYDCRVRRCDIAAGADPGPLDRRIEIKPIPKSCWGTVGAIAFTGCLIWGLSEQASKQVAARQMKIERGMVSDIDRVCAQWKQHSAQFNECGDAYRFYLKCESARLGI